VAEIAMLAVFRDFPDGKVVYIAPLKALVSERIQDWKIRIESKLNKKVVELTGDVAPDIGAIQVKVPSPIFIKLIFFLFILSVHEYNEDPSLRFNCFN
jgi:Lhr-like helicase